MEDLILRTGAHVRVLGKGRKERCTPLAKRTDSGPETMAQGTCARQLRSSSSQTAQGGRLSPDGVQYIVAKHVAASHSELCPSLVTEADDPARFSSYGRDGVLLAGVDRTVIALSLGHESIETTQIYLDANLAMKEEALAKVRPIGEKPRRYKPDDALLEFLKGL